jgi:hypothetical protein
MASISGNGTSITGTLGRSPQPGLEKLPHGFDIRRVPLHQIAGGAVSKYETRQMLQLVVQSVA